MSIMQQSSKAQGCTIGVLFQAIQQGQVKLPRLQRYVGAQDFADSKSASFKSILLASGEQPSLDSIWAASIHEENNE